MSKREQINVLPEALALRYVPSPGPTAAHPREAPARQAWELLPQRKVIQIHTCQPHRAQMCKCLISPWERTFLKSLVIDHLSNFQD